MLFVSPAGGGAGQMSGTQPRADPGRQGQGKVISPGSTVLSLYVAHLFLYVLQRAARGESAVCLLTSYSDEAGAQEAKAGDSIVERLSRVVSLEVSQG